VWQAEWVRRLFLAISFYEPVHERQQALAHKTWAETSIVRIPYSSAAHAAMLLRRCALWCIAERFEGPLKKMNSKYGLRFIPTPVGNTSF